MVGRTIPNNDEISNALCSLYAEGVLWLSGPSPNPSWPLPLPLPRREGEWLPRYPYGLDVGCLLSLISIENSSNVLWYLYAGGVLWAQNSAQKGSVKSVSSVRERNTLCEKKEYLPWEKELPSESHASHLIARVRSISHRVTQKNRTHRVSQRH